MRLLIVRENNTIELQAIRHIRLVEDWEHGLHTVELTAEVEAEPEWLITGATLRFERDDYDPGSTYELPLLKIICHRDFGRGPGPRFLYELVGATTAP